MLDIEHLNNSNKFLKSEIFNIFALIAVIPFKIFNIQIATLVAFLIVIVKIWD